MHLFVYAYIVRIGGERVGSFNTKGDARKWADELKAKNPGKPVVVIATKTDRTVYTAE